MAGPAYSSNIPDLADRDGRDLESSSPAGSGGLGESIAQAVAEGIRARTVDRGLDATGNPLAENEEPYRSQKARKYGSSKPLVRTGHMLKVESLKGQVAVDSDSVTMTYGTGATDEVGGSTDRDEGGWNSEKRPFYALDDDIIDDAVMPLVLEAFDRELKAQG
jgi:hypothetical protein